MCVLLLRSNACGSLKGSERGEVLVSISTDGRVIEWSMKKGLSSAILMVTHSPHS